MAHVTLLALIYFAFRESGPADSVLGVALPSMRALFGQPLQAITIYANGVFSAAGLDADVLGAGPADVSYA